MPIPKLHRITWCEQHPAELDAELSEIADNWSREQRRYVKEYGTPVLTVGEYTWFDLERPGCEIEGAAMGHCGNGRGWSDANVYSLRSRSVNRPGYWRPRVTLIMNNVKTGEVGEIKGYGNEKPSDKYHDALVVFCRLPRVTYLAGGGYIPENNFDLQDLDSDIRCALLRDKPTLTHWYEAYRVTGLTPLLKAQLHEELQARISYYDTNRPDLVGPVQPTVCLYHDTIETFAKEVKLTELASYAKIIGDGFEWYESGSRDPDEDSVRAFLEDEHYHHAHTKLARICQDLVDDCELELEEEINEKTIVTQPDTVIQLARDAPQGELHDALMLAAYRAEETGANDELWEHYQRLLSEIDDAVCGLLNITGDGENITIEVPLSCYAKAYDALFEAFGEEYDLNDATEFSEAMGAFSVVEALDALTYQHRIDLVVPYYGFSGFDTDAFKDELAYRLDEIEIPEVTTAVAA